MEKQSDVGAMGAGPVGCRAAVELTMGGLGVPALRRPAHAWEAKRKSS
jgi:thioredoxin reductase